MGGIWIETSSDVYFRERNEDEKVFKNIEIWAIIPVPVDGAIAPSKKFLRRPSESAKNVKRGT